MENHLNIIETISTALENWGIRNEYGDVTPEEAEFYAVLDVCYDLLTRTKLIRDIQVTMPEEMREVGDPTLVNKYGIAANEIIDMMFSAINSDGNFQVDFRKILRGLIYRANFRTTQVSLANEINVRQATISDYLTARKSMSTDNYQAAINALLKK